MIVIPTGSVQFRQDVFSTGVGFSDHSKIDKPCQIVSGGFYAIRWCVAKRFIRAAFEGIQTIYTNKELAIKSLAKYTKVNDEKILDESYRFSVEALSKEGMMPQEAFAALVEQLVSQKSIDEAASKKLPLTAYFDNRFVIELEKEGFFKKLWQ